MDGHQKQAVAFVNDAAAKKKTAGNAAHPGETVLLPESDFYCKLCAFDCVDNTGKLLHSLDASHIEAYLKSRQLASKKNPSHQGGPGVKSSGNKITFASCDFDQSGHKYMGNTRLNAFQPGCEVTTMGGAAKIVLSGLNISKNINDQELLDGKINGFHSANIVQDGITIQEEPRFSQKPSSKDRCRRIIIEGISAKSDKKMIIRHIAKYGLIKSNSFIGSTLHVEYEDWQSIERLYAEQAMGKIIVGGKEFPIKKSRKTLKRVMQIGKLPENIRTLFSSEENLLGQLDGFLANFQLTPHDIRNQQLACESVTRSLKCFAPRVHPYGSRVTGLASEDSDLDIYVEITKPFHYLDTKYLRSTQERIIQDAAANIMCSDDFSCVVQIPKASVPLLSCTHVPSGLKCDLTFRYPHQVHNTGLIRTYLSIDHRVRPLILLIRYWAKGHGILGKGKFSSYSLYLMCIFYLQQIPSEPILPSVAFLMAHAKDNERVSCNHWDCGFSEDISLVPKSVNDSSLFHLVRGFFKFFSEFDPYNSVVCPFLGRTLNKNIFQPGKEHLLPIEYEKYKSNCLEGLVEPLRVIHPFCIQDPFVHNSNVAVQNQDYIIRRFQILCHMYTYEN